MEKLQNEVHLTLRETETCLAATDVLQPQSDPGISSSKDQRRVLAVVSHQYMEDVGNHAVIPQREGCLFVMKYKSPSSPELYPHLLIPIDSNLSVSLSQRKSGSDMSELDIFITVPKGHIRLISKPSETLHDVLEECRRLQRLLDPYSNLFSPPPKPSEEETDKRLDILLKENDEHQFEHHWQWLQFYLNRRFSRIVPFIRPKPRDIRHVANGNDLSPVTVGLPGDEEGDITIIRDHWAHQQLIKRKSEYSQEKQLTMRIGTFNVNGKPPVEGLYSWVWGKERPVKDLPQLPSEPTVDPQLPDLFVFGFQEVDHSPESLIISSAASAAKCTAWVDAITTSMGTASQNFTMLSSQQLAGVFVVMFLRNELKEHVKDISSATAAIGFMGFMANKGAVAIRLTLYSTTITFVCSHLAAFDDYAEKRNSDFNELCRKLSFPLKWLDSRALHPATATIWETDALFWLGDLNYRIDLPDEEIRLHLLNHPRDLDDLLENDQLLKSKELEKAFVDFLEGQITFMPTYRFAGGLLKDGLGYDMKRRPAWTDRIMYRYAHSISVSQNTYGGHPTITQSDHHPVSANFGFTVLDIDPNSHHRVMKSIFQSLGDFEDADEIPSIEFPDGSHIDFGTISYDRPVTKTLTITNSGKTVLTFRFIPEEVELDKRWISITPSSGLLLPEESISISLTLTVNRPLAAMLNINPELHDKLFLHLLKGGDRIVSVSGVYKKSCFANSLPQLVTSKTPARFASNSPSSSENFTLNCPRELMFVINWLMSHGAEYPRLFLEPADEDIISIIREFLDTQLLDSETEVPFPQPEPVPKNKMAYAYAQILLRFLSSLQDPLIPNRLYTLCAQVRSREDVFEILNDIPGYARTALITVTSFVHFISHDQEPEEVDALAKTLAKVIFREEGTSILGIPTLTPFRKREFIRYIIS